MGMRRTLLGLIVAVAAGAAPHASDATTVTAIRWEASEGTAVKRLALTLSPRPDRVEVNAGADGVECFIAGARLSGTPPADVKTTVTGSGLRIVLGGAGAGVLGVSFGADRIVVSIAAGSAASAADSYRIGVGDLLTVHVYKNDDLTGDYTVSPEGTIQLPLVGAVSAAGRTEAELSQKLASILGGEFLVDPQVSVTVKTYQSQFVYVTGALANARRVALRPGMGLKGILADAGVALAPGQRIILKHTADGTDDATTLTSADLDKSDAPQPVDGDVVTVQERDCYYIRGEIRKAGKFPLEPRMTLLQAITTAEGLTEWANHSDVRIRRAVDGGTTEIKVNLKRVEDRRDPDPELEPQDQILVKRRVF